MWTEREFILSTHHFRSSNKQFGLQSGKAAKCFTTQSIHLIGHNQRLTAAPKRSISKISDFYHRFFPNSAILSSIGKTKYFHLVP